MLGQTSPVWLDIQNRVIQKLKAIIPKLPSLQIPFKGRKILQTNISQEF